MLEHGAELGNVERAPTLTKAPVYPAYQDGCDFSTGGGTDFCTLQVTDSVIISIWAWLLPNICERKKERMNESKSYLYRQAICKLVPRWGTCIHVLGVYVTK